MASLSPSVGLVEPWYGESHAAFWDGIRRNTRSTTSLISMDASRWRWRMRMGAWPLSILLNTLEPWPDIFLMSDYVNLPSLIGFAPRLAQTPVALYFHENQLTYPLRSGQKRDFEYGAINVLSCLAADRCVFCSRQQQEAFLDALPAFLDHDDTIDPVCVTTLIEDKCQVIPVGIDFALYDAARNSRPDRRGKPLRVVWPHRFEHDKNPRDFFSALMDLAREGLEFEVAAVGKSPGHLPPIMVEAARALDSRIVEWGSLGADRYAKALAASDVVVSTAWQETQGLAVIEAIRSGCEPLLPNRLSYPEVLGETLAGEHLYENNAHLRKRLRWMMKNPDAVRAKTFHWASMDRFSWTAVGPRFDALFAQLLE